MDSSFIYKDLPPRIVDAEDFKGLLCHMKKISASDLFLYTDSEAWVNVYNKRRPVTDRKLRRLEVSAILADAYGKQAEAILGTGKALNFGYEFRSNSGINKAGSRFRFRVNVVPSIKNGKDAYTMTIREIDPEPKSLESIQVCDEIVQTCVNSDNGLIFVCGATGQGKSTTLSSITAHILGQENSEHNIITIESPIEYVFDSVERSSATYTQIEVPKCLPSFSEGIREAMRMDPTIIYIGECRDEGTIRAAENASITGHLVLSTIHATTVPECLMRAIGFYDAQEAARAKISIVQACKMLVAQKLITTVDGKRTPIREHLIFSQEIKDQLLDSSNIVSDCFRLLDQFGRPMSRDIEQRYQDQIITVKEYDRQMFNYQSNIRQIRAESNG